jgi:hypothetical protein
MKTSLHLTLLALCSIGIVGARAATVSIDFNTNASYDENFVEKASSGNMSLDGAGNLTRVATTLAGTAVYNVNATGGSNGTGGTTFNATRSTFGGTDPFVLTLDFYYTAWDNQNSVGFYVKVPTGEGSGYSVVWRGNNNGDLRFFESGGTSNVNTGAVGTQVAGVGGNFTGGAGNLDLNNWYTARLSVVDVGSNVTFTASLINRTNSTQVGGNFTWTDSSSPVTGAGQVALRLGLGAGTAFYDNFTITMVPEPSTALALFAGFGGLALLRRRAR